MLRRARIGRAFGIGHAGSFNVAGMLRIGDADTARAYSGSTRRSRHRAGADVSDLADRRAGASAVRTASPPRPWRRAKPARSISVAHPQSDQRSSRPAARAPCALMQLIVEERLVVSDDDQYRDAVVDARPERGHAHQVIAIAKDRATAARARAAPHRQPCRDRADATAAVETDIEDAATAELTRPVRQWSMRDVPRAFRRDARGSATEDARSPLARSIAASAVSGAGLTDHGHAFAARRVAVSNGDQRIGRREDRQIGGRRRPYPCSSRCARIDRANTGGSCHPAVRRRTPGATCRRDRSSRGLESRRRHGSPASHRPSRTSSADTDAADAASETSRRS